MSKFDALIVDPGVETRMRLKQATSLLGEFGHVSQKQTTREALQNLSIGDKCDVVFVSHQIPQDELRKFIAQAKDLRSSRDAAFVLVLGVKGQDNSTVAQSVMFGADSVLFEPYSVDSLIEITHLAAKVRLERFNAREGAALSLLIKELMGQLDLVAELKKAGFEASISLKALKETCTVLKELSPESKAIYFEMAQKLFPEAPTPKFMLGKQYAGPSKRVQKKLEEKLLEDLKAESKLSKLG